MKKEFIAALSWMRKVQNASLFVPGISVCVEINYTPGNDYIDSDGNNRAYSCQIGVHGKNTSEYETADFTVWGGVEEFEKEKKNVQELLRSYGVNI